MWNSLVTFEREINPRFRVVLACPWTRVLATPVGKDAFVGPHLLNSLVSLLAALLSRLLAYLVLAMRFAHGWTTFRVARRLLQVPKESTEFRTPLLG